MRPVDRQTAHRITLAAAVGLPPAAWFGHLLLSYVLVPVACEYTTLPLHATTLAALALALGGGAVAVRARRSGVGRHGSPGDDFLFGAATIMSLVFAAVIVLAGVANLVVDACG